MKLKVKINLPKAHNKLEVRYNTFEKVSYDKYFIASLIKHNKNESEGYELIDEITGKGSLNDHFKKLYDEINEFSIIDVNNILKDSVYPIQKIDQYRYIYIPLLNISLFQNQVFDGNLNEDELFPRQLVGLNDTYVDHTYLDNEPFEKEDIYEVNLDDNITQIKINNEFYDIDPTKFQNIVVKDDMNIESYKGSIGTEIKGNNWIQLSKSRFNNIIDSKDYFYENGNHYGIYNTNTRESRIAYLWGLYWIKERTYNYDNPSSKDICEKVAQVLLESGRINEFKTKSLLSILDNINRDQQQEIINYILKRKDSKELARVAFILIDKGYEKGWNSETINVLFKFKENSKQLAALYKVNQTLPYNIDDLLEINNINRLILTEDHLHQIKDYQNDCEMIKQSMHKKIGEISLSGIREKYGKMPQNKDLKKFRHYMTTIMAHFSKDINDKNLIELRQFETRINDFYDLFKKVQIMVDTYLSDNN